MDCSRLTSWLEECVLPSIVRTTSIYLSPKMSPDHALGKDRRERARHKKRREALEVEPGALGAKIASSVSCDRTVAEAAEEVGVHPATHRLFIPLAKREAGLLLRRRHARGRASAFSAPGDALRPL